MNLRVGDRAATISRVLEKSCRMLRKGDFYAPQPLALITQQPCCHSARGKRTHEKLRHRNDRQPSSSSSRFNQVERHSGMEPRWMWLIPHRSLRSSRARRADVIRPSHALAHIQNRTTCEISSIGPGEGPALWLPCLRWRLVLTAVCQAMRLGLRCTIDAERTSVNARTITLPARHDRR